MKDKPDDKPSSPFSIPGAAASELRGRQSVRATFRLTEEAINMLSAVAVHMGIKQKSLFDHLMEDIKTLEQIADSIHAKEYQQRNRVQKTYVLSRRTLSSLERACRKFDAPRDAIVEFSIQRLMPILSREREKHKRRKAILEKMETFLKAGETLLMEAYGALGEDDPVFDRIERAVSMVKAAHQHVESYVERGDVIENIDLDDLAEQYS